jgi:hypothetical protein
MNMPQGISRPGFLSSSASGQVYSTPTNVNVASAISEIRRSQSNGIEGSADPTVSPTPAIPAMPKTSREAARRNVSGTSIAANARIPSRFTSAIATTMIVTHHLNESPRSRNAGSERIVAERNASEDPGKITIAK